MTYGGDLSPKECWEMLSSGAILVDVRTRAEWAYIGLPLLEDGMHPVIGQEWQVFPEMSVDPGFVGSLTLLNLNKWLPTKIRRFASFAGQECAASRQRGQ